MIKPEGYDSAATYTGESMALPKGKYICTIEGAKEVQSQSGSQQLVLMLDIADGEHKGFYKARYDADAQQNGAKAKWKCLHRQGFTGKSLPFFKGLITSIEESNSGYKWNWDEKTLKGKRIGVVFGREQFEAPDGELKWATKPVAIRSIQRLEEATVPEDKYLKKNDGGFADIPMSEDDLPF